MPQTTGASTWGKDLRCPPAPLEGSKGQLHPPPPAEDGLQRARHRACHIFLQLASEQETCFLTAGWKMIDVLPWEVCADAQIHSAAASAAAFPAALAQLPCRLFSEFPFKEICPLMLPRGQHRPAHHLSDRHTILLLLQREARPSSQSMLSPEPSRCAEASQVTPGAGRWHRLPRPRLFHLGLHFCSSGFPVIVLSGF